MAFPTKREILTKAGEYPYSPSVAFGSLIFISGIVGHDPISGEMPEAIGEQTKQIMTKIQNLLEQAGSSLQKALKVTIYLVDMSEFKQVNESYRTFFPNDFPARSCVQVAALPDPRARVEIDMIAAR